MMDALWQELTSGLHDSRQLAQVIIRLVAATLFGAIVGIQRESTRKPAGLRTHILVSLARRPRLRTCFSPLFIGEGTSSQRKSKSAVAQSVLQSSLHRRRHSTFRILRMPTCASSAFQSPLHRGRHFIGNKGLSTRKVF